MNEPMQDPQETRLRQIVAEVISRLRESGVPAAIAGAFAADHYRGSHRVTTDADFLVEWRVELPVLLEAAGFDFDTLLDDGEPHLIRARRGDDRVDLIVAGTAYQHLAIERARGGPLTVEDVLVHKVIAWRPKDRDDIASILSTGIEFDQEYVTHWVAEWDVAERWREAQTWR